MIKKSFFVIMIFLLFCGEGFANNRKEKIESMIERFGKQNIIDFILQTSSENKMTVQVENNLYLKRGRPSTEYITPLSIHYDLKRLKLNIDEASKGLSRFVKHKISLEEEKRKQREYWKKNPIERKTKPAQKQTKTIAKEIKVEEIPWYEKENYTKDDKIDAQMFVENRILGLLKSPSTAKFPSIWKWKMTKISGQTYRISSYVDAQNSFGAMIRTRFSGVAEQVSRGRWRLKSLSPWF